MVRKKPIRTNFKLPALRQSTLNPIDLISQSGIINQIASVRNDALIAAEQGYNASLYTKPDSNNTPIVIYNNYRPPINEGPAVRYKDSNKFVKDIYDSYLRAVTPNAGSETDAKRQAKYLTQKAAFETGYGRHIANTHNYGGHRTKKDGWLAFNSMDDFTKRDVALLDKKWGNWRNAKNDNEFVNAITSNNGMGAYAPRHEYNNYFGLSDKINTLIGMNKRKLKCGGQISRPKAWIGAAISAGTGILGSVLNANAQKKAQEEARRLQAMQQMNAYAAQNNKQLALNQNAQKEFETRFNLPYRIGGRIPYSLGGVFSSLPVGNILSILGSTAGNVVDELTTKNIDDNNENENTTVLKRGGKRRLKNGVQITDGGYSIPIGNDTFLLRGVSHEQVNETGKTGIGLNVDGKEIEAENGEVLQRTPKEVRIFSNSIILPNGMTPAEAVESGENKNAIFNVQQAMNGDYGISNKRRLRNGGTITRPVEIIKAQVGVKVTAPTHRNKSKLQLLKELNETARINKRKFPTKDSKTGNFVYRDPKTHTNIIRYGSYNPGNKLPSSIGIYYNNKTSQSFDPQGELGRYWNYDPNSIVNADSYVQFANKSNNSSNNNKLNNNVNYEKKSGR